MNWALSAWWVVGMLITIILPAPRYQMTPIQNQADLLQGWSPAYLRIDPGLLGENANLLLLEVPSGLPVRLKIPQINVYAAVEYVGLTSDGAMDTPQSIDDVGWFDLGQRPGETGSAVIDGHYGIKDGHVSVFDDLYKLRAGDTISVENDKGESISFIVRGSRRYDSDADASAVFSSDDGKAHLNLITCEGIWNAATGGYPQRLIVFTDKE